MENYFFLENYISSEGAVSHNCLYYQPIPIARNQESVNIYNYFEQLPVVFTAFNVDISIVYIRPLSLFEADLQVTISLSQI